MALEERSQIDTEEECTSCSVTGHQSTPDRQQQQRRHEQLDDTEEVELVDEALQGAVPTRWWTCSLPRVRFHTSDPAETVDIAMEEGGLAACEPLTVGQLMQRTVVRVPHRVALRYKTRDTWKDVTYRDYYNQCIAAAKSFIKLGLQPFQAVLIVGFTSPEWHISALGSIFAGPVGPGESSGVATGPPEITSPHHPPHTTSPPDTSTIDTSTTAPACKRRCKKRLSSGGSGVVSKDSSTGEKGEGGAEGGAQGGGEGGEVPTKKRTRVLGPALPPQWKRDMPEKKEGLGDQDPEFASWLPPDNQTGDGRTHLNEKFGY